MITNLLLKDHFMAVLIKELFIPLTIGPLDHHNLHTCQLFLVCRSKEFEGYARSHQSVTRLQGLCVVLVVKWQKNGQLISCFLPRKTGKT